MGFIGFMIEIEVEVERSSKYGSTTTNYALTIVYPGGV
jgi:hypothetical protein